jgi:DNA-binding transcriptional MerR regulator
MLAQLKPHVLTSGDVAQELGVTTAAVRLWVKRGRIVPAQTTTSGIHLFDAASVARLAAERKETEKARAKKRGAATGR